MKVLHEGHVYTVKLTKKVKREDPIWSGRYQIEVADGSWSKTIVYRFYMHDGIYRVNKPENSKSTGTSEESRRRQSFVDHLMQQHQSAIEEYIRELFDEGRLASERAAQLKELKEKRNSDYGYWHSRGYTLARGEQICVSPVRERDDDWIEWTESGEILLIKYGGRAIIPFRAYVVDRFREEKNRWGRSVVDVRALNLANGIRVAVQSEPMALPKSKRQYIVISSDEFARIILLCYAVFRYAERISRVSNRCRDHAKSLRKRSGELRIYNVFEPVLRSSWYGPAPRMVRVDVFYPLYMMSEILRSETPFWVGAVAQEYTMWLFEAYSPGGAVRSLRKASYTGRALQISEDHAVEAQAPSEVLEYLVANARSSHFIPAHLIEEFKERSAELLASFREPMAYHPRQHQVEFRIRQEQMRRRADSWEKRALAMDEMSFRVRSIPIKYVSGLDKVSNNSENTEAA